MEDFLDQIEAATQTDHLYYLALAGALAVPDICGALEAPDGEATGQRYKAWFDTNVSPLHMESSPGKTATCSDARSCIKDGLSIHEETSAGSCSPSRVPLSTSSI
jgi:hypothetical protein